MEIIKIKGEVIEAKKGEFTFEGDFQKLIRELTDEHNKDIVAKNFEIKDEKERLPYYKLQRVILVFGNGKNEAKRNIITEADDGSGLPL